MPLLRKHPLSSTSFIAEWRTEETVSELLRMTPLSASERRQLDAITAPHRMAEWLTGRLLVKRLLGKQCIVRYYPCGAPFADGSDRNISLSHSGNMVVLLAAKGPCGIDIEQTGRNYEKVWQKYMTAEEEALIGLPTAKAILWSGKEAVYKRLQKGEIPFVEGIRAIGFDPKTNETHYRTPYGDFRVYSYFTEDNDYIVSYTY